VGTGRCGSTLLSRMLAEHPRVLGIFEFFNGLDASRRFGEAPLDGPALAELLAAEQPFINAVLRRGYAVEEVTYPFRSPGASRRGSGPRYERGDPVPWLLVSCLPRLSEAPDTLFDAVVAFARQQPPRRPRDHSRALFAWLGARLGRDCWIERSGSSIDYLAALADEFPGARFLHLHRDGAEVALSMREHHAYRLPISLLYDVPLEDGRRVSQLPPLDLHGAPTDDDTISRILRSRPPAEHFGRYWSDQIARGLRALPRLAPGHFLQLRFEELVDDPRAALTRIADFFELGDAGDWIERAGALVRGLPPSRFDRLPPGEQARLAEACRPGRERLAASEHELR